MHMTRSFSITLPVEMADMVRTKVSSGEYASESDVITDGLRTLVARDVAIEKWLIEEVVPTYDAAKADPNRALSADEAWAKIERHMRAREESASE